MSDARALIDVVDLTVGWGADAVLLRGATFEVARGDVFLILGGSGCGKSTLLRHLVGLEQPMSGEITLAGVGTPRLDVGRPPFGVMFQGGALFGSLTVGENVALPVEQWTDLPR
jgi:phospholipid/cholesterol/gamma-HCH transport system ATP-binding protein